MKIHPSNDYPPPGPELDTLVAEKVMGYVVRKHCAWRDMESNQMVVCQGMYGEDPIVEGLREHPLLNEIINMPCDNVLNDDHFVVPCIVEPSGRCYGAVLSYSISISAAWEVVEKMRPLALHLYSYTDGWGDAVFADEFGPEGEDYRNKKIVPFFYADGVPHAICLAALKAVEEKR